jgi:hypothetical protein
MHAPLWERVYLCVLVSFMWAWLSGSSCTNLWITCAHVFLVCPYGGRFLGLPVSCPFQWVTHQEVASHWACAKVRACVRRHRAMPAYSLAGPHFCTCHLRWASSLTINPWILELGYQPTCKVEAPIRKMDLILQSIKAPIVATMHTQKWVAWILFTLE